MACHQRVWAYNSIKTLNLRYRRHGIKILLFGFIIKNENKVWMACH